MISEKIDANGFEVLSDRPVAVPVYVQGRRSTLQDLRDQYNLSRRIAEMDGKETPEEADDFNIGDDYDPSVPFEHHADHYAIDDLDAQVQSFLATQAQQQSEAPSGGTSLEGNAAQSSSPDK